MNERRKGLGRGLGALIPSAPAGTEPERGPLRPVDLFFGDNARQTSSLAVVDRSSDPRPADSQSAQPAQEQPSNVAPDQQSDATPIPVPTDEADGQRVTERKDETPSDDEQVELVDFGATFREIPIDSIRPNAKQPRQVFDEAELTELVASISEVGVLQPIVVRAVDGGYELVMGERRWRASRAAGLSAVPAIIRETGDDDMLRDALLENLHRSQLNPLEEAAAYDQLLKDFGCNHEELASRLRRSRPQISNTLRLLNLPPIVQRRVAAGVLSAGHARALLGLGAPDAMERLAQRIVAEGLSVRATEEIVALGGDENDPKPRKSRRTGPPDERMDAIAARLGDRLDTRVKIAMGARRGRLTVEFAGVEDLERILDLLVP